MQRLPPILILLVADHLNTNRDINALARTNRRFLFYLDPFLYRYSFRRDRNYAFSSLWLAVTSSQEACVKKFLAYAGMHIGASHISPNLSLIACFRSEVVTRLLLSHLPPDTRDECIRKALVETIYRYPSSATVLVDSYRGDLDSPDTGGRTLLSLAVGQRNEPMVQLLLDTGKVDVNTRDNQGLSPLSRAIYGRASAPIFRLLLDSGKADLELRDNHGRTPLSCVTKSSSKDGVKIVEMLLQTGKVDIDARDNHGRTPLSHAAKSSHVKILEVLLQKGEVDINSRDIHGRTPLSYAAQSSHVKILEVLLQKGEVDINSRDIHGRTPLSYAAQSSHVKILEMLLLTEKVDINLGDDRGSPPIHYAIHMRSRRNVTRLLQTGKVDFEYRENEGQTTLSLLKSWGSKPILKLLEDLQKA